MVNAGKYNKKISIFHKIVTYDDNGFKEIKKELFCRTWANVKTTKGYLLLQNNSEFEKAKTNFTIRYKDGITRDMIIEFMNKEYTILYLNNINANNVELEIQSQEVTK